MMRLGLLPLALLLLLLAAARRVRAFPDDALGQACQSGLREDNTNYIYCSRQNLTRIPALIVQSQVGSHGHSVGSDGGYLPNVVYDELVLSDNLIERIEAGSFGASLKARKIYLDANPLRSIHKNAFDSVRNYLEELYFEKKSLDAFPAVDELPEPQSEGEEAVVDDSAIFEQSVYQSCLNLRLLSIKNYRIGALKGNKLARLSRLETLVFSNNRLRRINEAAFAGLENSLVELNLDSNLLEWIPTRPLERLRRLKRLSLSQNRIRHLHANAFARFASLTVLDLSYNYLSRFDENAFAGPVQHTLRSLQIQNNELRWPHYLHLLFNLHALQELNIDFNKLASSSAASALRLPAVFRARDAEKVSLKLASLSMQGNGLGEQSLARFLSPYDYEALLKGLNSNEAVLGDAPVVSASSSSVMLEMNARFLQYPNLVKLNLARNKIHRIPDGFFTALNTSSLKALTLDKNPLQGLRERTFEGLESSLASLGLNGVGFSLWSPVHLQAIARLDALKILKLNGNANGAKIAPTNKLAYDNMMFKTASSSNRSTSILPSLVALELQHNGLKTLPEFLCKLTNLVDLDLSSNDLTSFNLDCLLSRRPLGASALSAELADATKLKQINLNNNKLRCDCSIRPLKVWLMRNYDKDLLEFVKWKCFEPFELNGRYLSNVGLNELVCDRNEPVIVLPEPEQPIVVIQPAVSPVLFLSSTTKTTSTTPETTQTTTTTQASTTSTTTTTTTTTIEKVDELDVDSLKMAVGLEKQVQKYEAEQTVSAAPANSNWLNMNNIGNYSIIIGTSFGVSIVCLTVFFLAYAAYTQRRFKSANSSNTTSSTGSADHLTYHLNSTSSSKGLLNHLVGGYKYEKKTPFSCSPCTTTSISSSTRTHSPSGGGDLVDAFAGVETARRFSGSSSGEVLLRMNAAAAAAVPGQMMFTCFNEPSRFHTLAPVAAMGNTSNSGNQYNSIQHFAVNNNRKSMNFCTLKPPIQDYNLRQQGHVHVQPHFYNDLNHVDLQQYNTIGDQVVCQVESSREPSIYSIEADTLKTNLIVNGESHIYHEISNNHVGTSQSKSAARRSNAGDRSFNTNHFSQSNLANFSSSNSSQPPRNQAADSLLMTHQSNRNPTNFNLSNSLFV